MCITNAIVFYSVPFSFTSPFATGVAFGLMVSLIHGLNLKGVILAMTMYMLKPYLERQTLITALNPPTVPSIVFLAPLAAFCSAFGVLWLLYDLFGYLHASTDDLRDFFGITLPAPSIVTLKDVKDRSITLNWQCSSQATISKHLIEIDGLIIGESGKQETSVVIQGLYPENTYRIRLWAITTRNWKTPSDFIIVRTLPAVPLELLELSSVENARKEKELTNNPDKESQGQQCATEHASEESKSTEHANSAQQSNNHTTKNDLSLTENEDTSLTSSSKSPVPSPTTTTQPAISVESRPPSPVPVTVDISEEQLLAIKKELEVKEAAHQTLTQQLADLEKQYRQQESHLRSEITKLREQQRQDDEPRQQARIKLRELEESLRESEANKSKIEKEHRMEMDKRQKMTDQLAAKQRKLDQLQSGLRQSQMKLEAEKATHQQQKKALEASLKKQAQEVLAAEESLKAAQESQKGLAATIESKEAELQKLQVTLNSPRSVHSWEQRSKDLDLKCSQLAEQLAQYKSENQQLQERLLEASKNVAKVRDEREGKRAQLLARASEPLAETDSGIQHSDTYVAHLSHDSASTWAGAEWGQSLGIRIMNGLFQDDLPAVESNPSLLRRSTGPPPGLTPKALNPDASSGTSDVSPSDTGRNRKESDVHGSIMDNTGGAALDSAVGGPIGHPFKNVRQNSGLRPRSSSILSTDSSFMDMASGSRYLDSDSPMPSTVTDAGRFRDSRSRASSVSSMSGFHSPQFEPSYSHPSQQQQQHQQQTQQTQQTHLYNTQQQQQLQTFDMNHSPLLHSQPLQHRSSLQRHPVSQSPRARFQSVVQTTQPSPTGQSYLSQWGVTPTPMKMKHAGLPATVGSSRFPTDMDSKTLQPPLPSQQMSYHRFFGSPGDSPSTSSQTDASAAMGLHIQHQNQHQIDFQMNEQNVIKSMFEAPEDVDLRHQLRTVSSHSSLGNQSKILPSHLRSISTPVTSSPLASPTTTTLPSYSQQSPIWDFKPIARPGTLGRMNSQAEGSSTSLNISDASSPTSPHLPTFTQAPPGFSRKAIVKDTTDRGLWGGYETRSRNQDGLGFIGTGLGSQFMESSNAVALGEDRAARTGTSGSMATNGSAGSRWLNENLAFDLEPWNHSSDSRPKPNRLLSASSAKSIGGAHGSTDGILSSPTGSTASSLESSTPLIGDAHARVFAEQYFSKHNHRFEAPSSLSSLSAFPSSSKSGESEHGPLISHGSGLSMAETTKNNGSGESDIFGYGLKLNPFGWPLPTNVGVENNVDQDRVNEANSAGTSQHE
ncbi:hypothetical protein BGZ94_008795 [Podila epigama]|nr:hypothetical protein BGZ94_008795 [Podila epigama]